MQGKRDSTIYSQIISIPTGRFFMLLKKSFAVIVISKKMCKIIIQSDFDFLIDLLYKVQIFWEGYKNWKTLPLFLTLLSNFKKSGIFFSNFVAFSQYLDFTRQSYCTLWIEIIQNFSWKGSGFWVIDSCLDRISCAIRIPAESLNWVVDFNRYQVSCFIVIISGRDECP